MIILIVVMEWLKRILLRLLEPIIGIPMESFFLPEKETPRGYSAIPEKFEIRREDFPETLLEHSNYAYEEEVYHLEPLRYPFKIQLMEDLPKRMIKQLKRSIRGKYASSQLYEALDLWKTFTSIEVFQARRATASVARDTWLFLMHAFKIIHPNDHFIAKSSAYSTDKRVMVNINLKLQSCSQTVVLGEALDARNAETYISDLVKLASGELPSSFEGEPPEKFVGHEAILTRVCLHMGGHIVKLIGHSSSYRT
jgi:hypothetical protein